jgi:hypothetical protein
VITNKNSIKFNGYLLRRRLNSTNAYFKPCTKTQIKHKNSTNPLKQNTKQTKAQQSRKEAIGKYWGKTPNNNLHESAQGEQTVMLN